MADPTQQGQQGSQGDNPGSGQGSGQPPSPPPVPPAAPPSEGDESWRNSPGALAMRQQIADERSKREALEAKIKQQAEEEERKRLEAEGKYKEIAEDEKRKREAAEAQHQAYVRRTTFESSLRSSGLGQELLDLSNDIQSLPSDGDIAEYVDGLKKKYEKLFSVEGYRGSETPAQGGRSAMSSQPNWDEVKRWEISGTPEEKEKARQMIKKHRLETGEYPYHL